jgi:two-component system cell cycle sensor histidine kinase/response regulator CckA
MSRDVRVLVWLPDRPARPDIAAIPAANREWLLPRSMVSEPQRGASRKNVEGNSEHTAADRALRESEARFRTLVESANDAIFIWDRDLRCLEANRAACERLGYSHAELLTMTAADVSAPEQAASAAARAEAIARLGSATVESVHKARDGTLIPVEVSTTVTSLGGRPVFLSIARDISKRRLRGRDRARLQPP